MEIWQNRSINDLNGEMWVDIVGYEGLYKVSNMGRVKTMERPDLETGYGNYYRESLIRKQNLGTSQYPSLILFRDKRRRPRMVHRIVAEHFLPNPENKRCVNHKNGIKTDNRLDNLEWMTHSENSYHKFQIGLQVNKKGGDSKLSKPVNKLDLNGNFIKKYNSLTEAGINNRAKSWSISNVCNKAKYRKTCAGYKWEFAK